MGLFDKVKGMMLEDEGEATTVQKPAPQAPGAPAKSGMSYTPTNALNTGMVEAIRKATYSRNTALTALITASDALADIIPDPVMRLKAAQKTAGAGRSGKEISDAVAIHLNDVDAEEMRFGQMLTTKINGEVGGLTRQAEATESAINAASTEIQNLQQRIAHLTQQIQENTNKASNLRGEAAAKEGELRTAETEFKAAAAAVRNELNGHKNTILSTLG